MIIAHGGADLDISIHALVKRATLELLADRIESLISIHALVKRATGHAKGFRPTQYDFNPRPREEGDNTILYL